MIIPRYTEVVYNLINDPNMKLILDNKMSTYPLYKSTSKHEFGIPNIIPTREELNKKILDYYKYREIGFETVGRFLDELEIALNEIMPYYNQLFFSADQDYNVIYNVDYIRTIDRNKDNTSVSRQNSTTSANQNTTTTGNTTTYAKDISSDTPQSNISTANTDIDHVDYANNISWNKTNGSDSGTSSGTSQTTGNNTMNQTDSENEGTIETTKGNFGVTSAQDLIAKYRSIIINIEQQIINDPRITELFMLIY